MELWIQMDFNLFYSWMTDRCWRFLGFTLEEQEEKNTVQSKIKCIKKKKIQEKYKTNSLLIWFLGQWHWTNVHKCLILTKEQMVSSTLPNSELEAITVLGVDSELKLDQHNNDQRPGWVLCSEDA